MKRSSFITNISILNGVKTKPQRIIGKCLTDGKWFCKIKPDK